MHNDQPNLPADNAQLKDLIAAFKLDLEKSQEKIHHLEERIRLLQNELFGRKSEKHYPEDHRQLAIFEARADDADHPGDPDTIAIVAHSRKKSGRRALPENLPRAEIIHDLPEEEKVCGCGAKLSRIGQDVCEKLDYIPAKMRVLRHIRLKYACKSCEGVESDGPTVKIAPPPAQLIPKSMVTEALLAHIIVSKFADALPLYRQQKIFARLGVELSRATMANWAIAAAQRCSPLIELFEDAIRSGPLINIDETPLQVLNEPGRANTSQSYMWVFCGGQPAQPVYLYRYHPSRSGKVALSFLRGYRGYVQSDDFSGYGHLDQNRSIGHLGCWAHARRKFVEVAKARKKVRGKVDGPKSLADEALQYIAAIYLVEKQAREKGLSPDEIHAFRQEKAKPVLEQFRTWLERTRPLTPPKGLLGIAITYALGNWPKLIVYLEDGRLRPDNNVAENAIRPFVLGRKNWLFAGHPNGADAGATFFSLIETAKANGLEPFGYLRHIFEKLPLIENPDGYRSLLPWIVSRTVLNCSRP
jgi:transposase